MNHAAPRHSPGGNLADELAELGVTPTELSRQINVPPNRVTQIIHGRRGITGDTALRLGHWFGTSAQFWLNLQSAYDIRVAGEKAGQENGRDFPPGPQVRLWTSRSSDMHLPVLEQALDHLLEEIRPPLGELAPEKRLPRLNMYNQLWRSLHERNRAGALHA